MKKLRSARKKIRRIYWFDSLEITEPIRRKKTIPFKSSKFTRTFSVGSKKKQNKRKKTKSTKLWQVFLWRRPHLTTETHKKINIINPIQRVKSNNKKKVWVFGAWSFLILHIHYHHHHFFRLIYLFLSSFIVHHPFIVCVDDGMKTITKKKPNNC